MRILVGIWCYVIAIAFVAMIWYTIPMISGDFVDYRVMGSGDCLFALVVGITLVLVESAVAVFLLVLPWKPAVIKFVVNLPVLVSSDTERGN